MIESFQAFMETGGTVLWLILLLSIALWGLIIERFMFIHQVYPEHREQWLATWRARDDKQSWHAQSIRRFFISQAKMELGRSVMIIKVLIALCPLLGLLGTVLGMIHVFDVMAVIGTSNARAMATGISQATLTTMAGMVIAISGLYFSKLIEDRVDDEAHHLADLMTYE